MRAVVIDHGSFAVKGGFAGDTAPSVVVRNAVARCNDGGGGVLVGEQALARRATHSLRCPIEEGRVVHYDDMKEIWEHIFNELGVRASSQPLLVTVPPTLPPSEKEKLCAALFHALHVPSLFLQLPQVLALRDAGRAIGVVLDVGYERSTWAVPVYQGCALQSAIQWLPISGWDITMYLKFLLEERGITLEPKDALRNLKERAAYIPRQFHDSESDLADIEEVSYELEGRDAITLGKERLFCGQALFTPHVMGNERAGVAELVFNAIMRSPKEVRGEMYRSIVLAGGTARMPGFPQRLASELREIDHSPDLVEVLCGDAPEHSAWRGGSLIASDPAFDSMCITCSEFESYGPSIANRKCF